MRWTSLGGVSTRQGLSVPTCAEVLPFMVCGKRARSRARGYGGGRPHCRSAQAVARSKALAQQRLRDVWSRRLARCPVRRVILGHQAQLILAQRCAEQEAPALLQAAAVDLATRLQSNPEQAVRRNGNPDVKIPDKRHHCRHRWRILVEGAGGGVVYLSVSTRHGEGGVGLPYVWVQGMLALVWQDAGFLRARRRAGDCSVDLAAPQPYPEDHSRLIGDICLPPCGALFSRAVWVLRV